MRYLSFCDQLISLSIMSSRFTGVVWHSKGFSSFSGWIIFYCVLYICHIWSVRSCVDGYLGCFPLLSVASSAAMNMGVQIPLRHPDFNSFAYILRSRLQDHVVVLFLTFRRNSVLFFVVVVAFHNPTNSAQWFQFLHILTKTCYFPFLSLSFFFC